MKRYLSTESSAAAGIEKGFRVGSNVADWEAQRHISDLDNIKNRGYSEIYVRVRKLLINSEIQILKDIHPETLH